MNDLSRRFRARIEQEGFRLPAENVTKADVFRACSHISDFLKLEGFGPSAGTDVHNDTSTRSLYRTLHESSPSNHKAIPMVSACVFIFLFQTLNMRYKGKKMMIEPIEFPNHILVCVPFEDSLEDQREEVEVGEVRWIWEELSREGSMVKVNRRAYIQLTQRRDLQEDVAVTLPSDKWRGTRVERKFYFSLIDGSKPVSRITDWSKFMEIPPEGESGMLRDMLGMWMNPENNLDFIMFRQSNNLVSTAFLLEQQRALRAQHPQFPHVPAPHINTWNIFNPLLVTSIMAVLHTEWCKQEAMFGNLLSWFCGCLSNYWMSGGRVVRKWILKGGPQAEMEDGGWIYTQLRETCDELEREPHKTSEEVRLRKPGADPAFKVGQVFKHRPYPTSFLGVPKALIF
ncbi:hypothetical protein BT69DRAFT_21365 [Atractiella rhizophila]|nr:hypothetical protein BT69DRAFT_21365 [Atractiella rhizophila]